MRLSTMPKAAPAAAAHRLLHGAVLQSSIARDAIEPIAYSRMVAAGFAHHHQLPIRAADDLVQIVDALVSNADRHATWPGPGGTIELRLTVIGCSVVIEVTDPDADHMPVWPCAAAWTDHALAWLDDPDADPDDYRFASHGRGLLDVAARAEAVTTYREGDTKTVRAVLAVDQP